MSRGVLQIRKTPEHSGCMFIRRLNDGRIASVWGRGPGDWPVDQTFDPPIAEADLPSDWIAAQAVCGPALAFTLGGLFGGGEVDR